MKDFFPSKFGPKTWMRSIQRSILSTAEYGKYGHLAGLEPLPNIGESRGEPGRASQQLLHSELFILFSSGWARAPPLRESHGDTLPGVPLAHMCSRNGYCLPLQ